MNKNNERILLLVIGGLIGFLIGYAVFGGTKIPAQSNASVKGSTTATSTIQTNTTAGDIEFTSKVEDQPAGKQVSVMIETSGPVWVAIREVDAEGKASNILGAHLFNESATMSIDLLRETTPDVSYALSAYEDNGDRIFEFKGEDKAITSTDGSDTLSKFKTYPTTPR